VFTKEGGIDISRQCLPWKSLWISAASQWLGLLTIRSSGSGASEKASVTADSTSSRVIKLLVLSREPHLTLVYQIEIGIARLR
jgi:hypothetical protein